MVSRHPFDSEDEGYLCDICSLHRGHAVHLLDETVVYTVRNRANSHIRETRECGPDESPLQVIQDLLEKYRGKNIKLEQEVKK
jgi:hypothetical protein